ncbi:amino acid adenylation domain-containing protein, partial [Streptomyces sedi]|uniref:amino acid adenylation domain-containing protein n=1 Tax=Streptomyces sedi TaxID=555059 RepID=UPI0031E51073
DRTLTYQELHDHASQVAWWLRNHDAQPGQLVAIIMDKSWEQIVAAYGVLLSGAAYLPIDPNTPTERLTTLLQRSQTKLILTQTHHTTHLPNLPHTTHLTLDTPLPNTNTPHPTQTPNDLAYTLFTSGSTGEPKGAMLAHRGLINALEATIQEFNINPTDKILGLTALHHDMSLFDTFGILGAGGTLILPDPDKTRDATHWHHLINTHHITRWNSVPAMMEMLLQHTQPNSIPTLKTAFLGGDWIPLTLHPHLTTAAPNAELVSVGGPTETTLWNIWHRVTTINPNWTSIPYGRPIPNTTYHILNQRLEPCPTWVTGEMYVSGIGLTHGYWNDPQRTTNAFTTHPHTKETLYRTGDLGRWHPNGTIEFIGRADHQIKIRGMRIELGDIETHLTHHPHINTAI